MQNSERSPEETEPLFALILLQISILQVSRISDFGLEDRGSLRRDASAHFQAAVELLLKSQPRPPPTFRAMTAPTIIFDLGNVLVRHDDELLHDRLASCCADPDAARPQMGAWLREEGLGLGTLSVEAFHGRLAAERGYKASYPRFLSLWSSHFSEEPGMESLVRALKERYRVVLFSNTNAAHIDHIRANYPVFRHVHAHYLSYELGLAKPDSASYQKVLELEGRSPQECIFIDDRVENTAAAAALGLRTATFAGKDALTEFLEGHGVLLEA